MTKKQKLKYFFENDYRDFMLEYGYGEAAVDRTVMSLCKRYIEDVSFDRGHRFSSKVLETFPELEEMLNEPDEA